MKRDTGLVRRVRRWYARATVDGRDVRKSLGTDDLQQARRRYRELLAKGWPEERVERQSVTVRQLVDRWLKVRIATGRNARNAELAKRRSELYLVPFLGDLRLSKVRPDHLRELRLWLESKPIGRRKKKLSTMTVAHVLGDVRNFFLWCEESGYTERAPIPAKLLPRIQERPPDRLDDVQVAKLVGMPAPYGRTVRLLLATGLRWGEACRALVADIEGDMLVVHQTKSGRVRRVPIAPEIRAELPHVGKVIPYQETSSGSFNRTVRNLSKVAGFHVHQLRHTMACRWLEAGGSLPALQQILGHASIATTRRYGRLSDEHVRAEAERLAWKSAQS